MAVKPTKKEVLSKAKVIRARHGRAAKKATEVESAPPAAEPVPFGAEGDIRSILLPISRKPWYSRAWDWLNSC